MASFQWRLSRKFGTRERTLRREVLERRLVQRLNPGSVGGFQKMRKPVRETGLLPKGSPIRTEYSTNEGFQGATTSGYGP